MRCDNGQNGQQVACCGCCCHLPQVASWQPDLSICSSTVSIRSCDRYLTFFGDQLTPLGRQRQLPPREAQLIIPAPCCFHRVMCRSVYFRSCADTRRQLIAGNTCQGIQAAAAAAGVVVAGAAAAAGVGCCNCHCRCLSFALAKQDLSPANDTTRRSPGCQVRCPVWLLDCFVIFISASSKS